jgi:hypothetical protein
MTLPQAIQNQDKKADELMGQLAKGELVDVIVDDPAKTPAKPAEEPKKETLAPALAGEGTVTKAEHDALNQKYLVLQGKYNHETAELRRMVEQANTTITRQNEMILDLHSRLNALEKGVAGEGGGAGQGDGEGAKPANPPAKSGPKKLNPEDFEGYGSEMRDFVLGFNALLDENAQLKGNMAKAHEDDASRAWVNFKDRLTALVSDWEVLNYDQGFLNWLEGTDSDLDPVTRKQKLQYYVERLDAEKCAKFFEVYKKSPVYTPPGAAAAGAGDNRPKKEEHVQPDQSASGADAPIAGSDIGEVTVEAYNQAVKDYTQKRISYAEFEKISDAYQRGLAKKLGKK